MRRLRLRFPRPVVLRPADHLLARAVMFIGVGLFLWTLAGAPGSLAAEARYQTVRSVATGSFGIWEPDTPEARAVIESDLGVSTSDQRRAQSAPWFQLPAVPLWWIGSGMARLAPAHESAHAHSQPNFVDPWIASNGDQEVQRSEYFAHFWVGLIDPLASAAMLLLLVFSARRLGVSRRASLWCALAFAVSTWWWPQATGNRDQVLPSLALFAGLASVIEARARFARFEAPRAWLWLSHGTATGSLFWGRPELSWAALACACLGLWVALAGRRRLWSSPLLRGEAGAGKALRDGAWIFGPWALIGALHFSWAAALGASGTSAPFDPDLALWNHPEPWSRAAALIWGPGEGLLLFAPLLAIGLWNLVVGRVEPFVAGGAGIVAFAVLVGAGGGSALDDGFGPGRMLPALAPLWLWMLPALGPLAAVRGGRVALGVATALGMLVNGPGLGVSSSTYVHLVTEHAHAQAAERVNAQAAELTNAQAAELESRQADDGVQVGETPARWDALDRSVQWELGLAQPWAHWRILRHRAAGLPESFPLGRLFFSDVVEYARPARERDEGFAHLGWVDLDKRLGGPIWPAILLALVCLGWGLAASVRALDPTRP